MEADAEVTKVNKRRRDPERTREAILEVAGKLLASDGPEGLSVSKVAQMVGVNRGTAYHHFQTRDQLLSATVAWVSEKLCRESFGDDANATDPSSTKVRPGQLVENLSKFAIENPEYGRVWLVSILDPEKRANDPYWKRYKAMMEKFVLSDLAEPNIDPEVHAMMMVVGSVLWPVWSRAGKSDESEKHDLVKRFTDEVMRLNKNGIIKSDKLPVFDGEAPPQ
ncbi:TetR/AcrR family transcriptional regulator [Aestuariicella hydrocarbonica]|uniref:TetR/AcrR family transcriptional regulator n=1 Tax=Pseudomaricurvus hydrocarbonicus TaxID=1470433 RepID=A0A9E5MM07_9GAMM|nr:TetR/AcrR family transcriptional regulator [Aestuariicella hydrocarbonica]NHO65963.1 TetR/AcrR family transcriptional regulator [Aestuariicella hydrocarbonica]